MSCSVSASAGTGPRRPTTASTSRARHAGWREHLAVHAGPLVDDDQAEYHGEFVDLDPCWSAGRSRCSSRGAASSSGAGPTPRCFAAVPTTPTAGSRSAAGSWPRPSPGCAALAEAAGPRPRPARVVPFGTIADEAKLEHYAGLGVRRGRAADPGRRPVVHAGRAGVAGATGPLCGHTGATMTDVTDRRDDTTPRVGSSTPLPKIISVDDHIVEPPHLWDAWLPARYRDRGPKAERRGIGEMEHIGGGHLPPDLRPRRAPGGLLGLRGPRLHQQASCRRRRLRPRRHDDVTDHLRRDAPRLLRAQGPHRRQGGQLGRGVALLPDLPPLLRPDLPRGQGPGAGRGAASAPTTTGWSRSGAATAAAACIPLCLIPLWDADKAAAEVRRNAARGVRAVCFSEIPPHLGLPEHPHGGYWDPFFAACEETGTVVCMHIGSSSKMPATSADAPRRRGGDAELRQRHGLARRLPLLAASSCASPTSSWPTRRARSAGSPTSSSGPTTCGARHRAGAA